MPIPESTASKSHLRKSMRRLAAGAPPDSRAVCDGVDRWLADHAGPRVIAVFAALPGEVDLAEIVARHADRCWVYPRVAGDDLVFHVVRNPAVELVAGAFGIREPSPTLAAIAATRIDAFLCPGLAFDLHGGRLGRGRGFYDRMLAGARPDAVKVGVCFDQQIVKDIFPEPHDVRMDVIISG